MFDGLKFHIDKILLTIWEMYFKLKNKILVFIIYAIPNNKYFIVPSRKKLSFPYLKERLKFEHQLRKINFPVFILPH